MSRSIRDPRDLPATGGQVPDYTALARATDRFVREYAAELARRHRQRRARLVEIARSPQAPRAFAAHAAGVRRALLGALGGFPPIPRRPRPLLARTSPVVGARPVPAIREGTMVVRRYEMPSAGRGGGDLGLLEIRVRGADPRPLLVLLGDAGRYLQGGDGPETVAGRWGYAFAAAGWIVAVPDLPSLRDLSGTRNKALLLGGTCCLGELVDDAERVLTAALHLTGVDTQRTWIGGSGLGGLVALMLAALDGRIRGCLSADAPRKGDLDSADALTVPRMHLLTDMAEVSAAIAPAPLALLVTGSSPWGDAGGSPGWVDGSVQAARRACRAPRGSYLRLEARGYSTRGVQRLIGWMARKALGRRSRRPGAAVRDHRPPCLPRRLRPPRPVRIAAIRSLAQWRRQRGALRRAFFRVLGQPARHKPHRVVPIAHDELDDCFREEIDVWSSPHTGAKVLFLRPKRPRAADGPNPTVLCLPGSSSHAGRVEAAYAHEVVARGWNAVVADCRARLYRHFPGIRAGRVLVGQSVYDQLCVVDYLLTRPDVHPRRIGAMGLSQGGIHAWMLAALDERIAAAAPVCGLASYRSIVEDVRDDRYDGAGLSFLDSHSYYYYLPGVLRLAEQADLMGLIAPRPLAVLGAKRDHCFPLRGIREVHRDLKHVYGLYGAADRLSIFLFDGRHSMPPLLRRKAYGFFEKHL